MYSCVFYCKNQPRECKLHWVIFLLNNIFSSKHRTETFSVNCRRKLIHKLTFFVLYKWLLNCVTAKTKRMTFCDCMVTSTNWLTIYQVPKMPYALAIIMLLQGYLIWSGMFGFTGLKIQLATNLQCTHECIQQLYSWVVTTFLSPTDAMNLPR